MIKIQKEYWQVIIASILFGGIVFGGKLFADAGLSMYEISLLPVILTVILIFPYIAKKRMLVPTKGVVPIIILEGIINVFAVTSQFAAVIMGVPVAIVVLLLYTQPIWTLIISKFLLKEKVTIKQIISCFIIILGILFLVNPFGVSHAATAGIIMALIGGLGLTSWVIAGSVLSKRGNEPMNTFFWSMVSTTIFCLALLPIANIFIKSPEFTHFSFAWPLKIWAYIFLFSLTTKIISHLLYLHGVKKVSTIDAGIIMLLEPVSGAVLAAIFIHQPITLNIIIGGTLILIANYLVITKKVKTSVPNLKEVID